MKKLSDLRKEAQNQRDWMTHRRPFLALFPSGAYNGSFIDPWMGVMEIKGIEGVVACFDVDMNEIQAIWID